MKGGHAEQQKNVSAIKAPWFIRQPACQTREAADDSLGEAKMGRQLGRGRGHRGRRV